MHTRGSTVFTDLSIKHSSMDRRSGHHDKVVFTQRAIRRTHIYIPLI